MDSLDANAEDGTFVRKHRDKIERVATVLLQRRTLAEDEIDDLMR